MSEKLELLPAVDIADGQAVRLMQGVSGTETRYGNPVEAALQWQEAGAEWIHLVDLDAAFGRGDNRELVTQVIDACNIKVELSGGIRDDASLTAAVKVGATRVNLGTAALEDPEWTAGVIQEYGGLVAVGLDVRGENLAARGWVNEGGNVWEVLERLEANGCARYVVTDVARDGTLHGPNVRLLEEVLKRTEKPVVASGGVASLADIAALRALVPYGLEGAIVGKALYTGAFTLEKAIEVASH